MGLMDLRQGENESALFAAKVVMILDRQHEMPVILVCCDASISFFALSLYNAELPKVAAAVVPMKSLVHILKPKFRLISVKTLDGTELAYPCVRVAHPGDIKVVGKGPLDAATV